MSYTIYFITSYITYSLHHTGTHYICLRLYLWVPFSIRNWTSGARVDTHEHGHTNNRGQSTRQPANQQKSRRYVWPLLILAHGFNTLQKIPRKLIFKLFFVLKRNDSIEPSFFCYACYDLLKHLFIMIPQKRSNKQ